MSRSAFAARFTELVGEPVMQYVTRWRMQVALRAQGRRRHRRRTRRPARLPLRGRVRRAFKRVLGASPGAIRKSAGERENVLTGCSASYATFERR